MPTPTSAAATPSSKPQFLDEHAWCSCSRRSCRSGPTKFALETDLLERDYYTHWQGLKKHFAAEVDSAK